VPDFSSESPRVAVTRVGAELSESATIHYSINHSQAKRTSSSASPLTPPRRVFFTHLQGRILCQYTELGPQAVVRSFTTANVLLDAYIDGVAAGNARTYGGFGGPPLPGTEVLYPTGIGLPLHGGLGESSRQLETMGA